MSSGFLFDRSGSCTAGGTAQDVIVANNGRQYLIFVNVSDTAMKLAFGAAATTDSIVVAANGGTFTMDGSGFVSTDKLSMFCATTGKKFAAYEG